MVHWPLRQVYDIKTKSAIPTRLTANDSNLLMFLYRSSCTARITQRSVSTTQALTQALYKSAYTKKHDVIQPRLFWLRKPWGAYFVRWENRCKSIAKRGSAVVHKGKQLPGTH